MSIRHRRRLAAALTAASLGLLRGPARADIGIGAKFGEVILENVQPGRTYNLREASHVPFGIENKSDVDLDVVVEFERPSASSINKDYEAVPDPGWFKVLPGKIRIGAHSVGYFDLLLSVPDDPALRGKHYQVSVKARTAGPGMLNLGIENKIRFSIGPGPQTLAEEKRQKAMQQLDFDVTPGELYLRDVPVGKAYDARRQGRKSIRVANYSQDKLEIVMAVEAWNRNYRMPEGYEPIPDPGWITVQVSTVVVAAEAIGVQGLTVRVPDDKQWRGRRFAVMVRSGLSTGFWLDAPVKVYLETEKEERGGP